MTTRNGDSEGTTRIKGNAHLSPSRISRAYLQMMEIAQTAQPYFSQMALDKFLGFYHNRGYALTTGLKDGQKPEDIDTPEQLSKELFHQVSVQQLEIARTLDRFLREQRGRDLENRTDYYLTTEESDAAKRAGIFNSICLDNATIEMDRVPELLVRKTQARTRYLNQSKGHKIGTDPKPCKRNQKKRVKFSYRPEIPHQNAGNGENASASLNGEDYEEFDRPKYDRKDEPEQTIPKIEWQVVRNWRNAGRTWKAHMKDIRESRRIREQLQETREHYQTHKIPKKARYDSDY